MNRKNQKEMKQQTRKCKHANKNTKKILLHFGVSWFCLVCSCQLLNHKS
jgi:hypothetical protein